MYNHYSPACPQAPPSLFVFVWNNEKVCGAQGWDRSTIINSVKTEVSIIYAYSGLAETPIVVTWVTFALTNASQVQYWLHGDPSSTNRTAVGSSEKFVDHEMVVRYIHRVWLATTIPTQIYSMSVPSLVVLWMYA